MTLREGTVMVDRRQEPRIAGVYEARWHPQSAAAFCALTDLSWHGCFVNVVYPPVVGATTTVSVTLRGTRVELHGQVRHAQPRIGFGMQIDPAWPMTEPERQAMRVLLNETQTPSELD